MATSTKMLPCCFIRQFGIRKVYIRSVIGSAAFTKRIARLKEPMERLGIVKFPFQSAALGIVKASFDLRSSSFAPRTYKQA